MRDSIAAVPTLKVGLGNVGGVDVVHIRLQFVRSYCDFSLSRVAASSAFTYSIGSRGQPSISTADAAVGAVMAMAAGSTAKLEKNRLRLWSIYFVTLDYSAQNTQLMLAEG